MTPKLFETVLDKYVIKHDISLKSLNEMTYIYLATVLFLKIFLWRFWYVCVYISTYILYKYNLLSSVEEATQTWHHGFGKSTFIILLY